MEPYDKGISYLHSSPVLRIGVSLHPKPETSLGPRERSNRGARLGP